MQKRILVVDDEPDIQELVKMRLEAEGYEVITASDGQEGLEILKETKPDLIVLDIMMPKIDGYNMLKIIKLDETLKEIPVIILTCREKLAELFSPTEIMAYIVKPYKPSDLLDKVNAVLKKSPESK